MQKELELFREFLKDQADYCESHLGENLGRHDESYWNIRTTDYKSTLIAFDSLFKIWLKK